MELQKLSTIPVYIKTSENMAIRGVRANARVDSDGEMEILFVVFEGRVIKLQFPEVFNIVIDSKFRC
jgi:hypothetical protein